MARKGFVPILILITITIISAAIFLIFKSDKKNQQNKNINPQTLNRAKSNIQQKPIQDIQISNLNSALLPSSTPTPSPTPESQIESLVTGILAPTPTPTPKPTPLPPQSPGSTASGANYTVSTFNLGSISVVTDSAYDDDCSNNCATKSLSQFVSDNGGRAGINGTYFCPPDYSWCAGKVNSTDFPIWNNRKHKWMSSSSLFWNGRAMFVFRGGSPQFYPNSASVGAPSDITAGIVNYPALIAGGNVVYNSSTLSDGDKLKTSRGTRNGIGTGNGKLFLVVARNANMEDLVGIFKSLGATDAMNTDGGGSSALYDGGYKVGPGRSLPNALIVK